MPIPRIKPPREVQVVNVNDDMINPATEETLQNLLELSENSFSETMDITYNSDGNVSQIVVTKELPTGTVTITYSLTYDSNGNITRIEKEVS